MESEDLFFMELWARVAVPLAPVLVNALKALYHFEITRIK